MSNSSNKIMFTLAAVFNWVVGLAMVIDVTWMMESMGVTPLPTEFTFIRILGGLILIFGLGYYWAGSDLRANAPIIRLGVIGKLWVFAVAVFEVLSGHISWHFLLVASGDLIFALLFIRALRGMQS